MFKVDYSNIDLGPFDFESYEFDPQKNTPLLREKKETVQEFLYKNLKRLDPKSGKLVPYYG